MFAGLIVILGFIAFMFLTAPRPLEVEVNPDYAPDLTNGQSLFWVGGCASCHALPGAEGDEKLKLGGGLELDTPFGVFRVPNISPDRDTGIGQWSDLDFINAMKRGISPDGGHYYPAFPYTSYQHITLEDLIDLKTYLFSLPPVAMEVAGHDLGFPFSIRRGLGLWKLRYFTDNETRHQSGATSEIERGRYLVNGPGHCGVCHTPRDPFGGEISELYLSGADALEEGEGETGGRIPNITPHSDGIGGWSLQDISYALESGFKPDFDSFGGSMVDVQENLSKISAEDRQAIAAYLKSIPGLPSSSQ